MINYSIWRDYEVCIRWTLYYPMRPRERICEWWWSDATDAGRARDKGNMANIDCIHTRTYFLAFALVK